MKVVVVNVQHLKTENENIITAILCIYAYKEIVQCIENGLESSFHKTGFFSYLLECDAQMIQ